MKFEMSESFDKNGLKNRRCIVHLTMNSLFCDFYFTQRQMISFFFNSVIQRDLLRFR